MDYRNDPDYQTFLKETQQQPQATTPQTPQQSSVEDYRNDPDYEQFKAEKVAQARKQLKFDTGNETVNGFVRDNLINNDFTLGASKNFLDYTASATKFVGRMGKKMGFDDFNAKAERVSDRFARKSQQVTNAIDNEWVGFAGEMLGDPLNLTPAGIYTKGTKASIIGKSMLAGAGIGAGTMAFKNYGNDTLTQEQKNMEMGIGAGFVSIINGVIAGVTKGRVSGINPDLFTNPNGAQKTPDEIANAILKELDALGVDAKEAEVIVGEVLSGKYPKFDANFAKERPFPEAPYTPNFTMKPTHQVVPMTREKALDVIFRKANEEAIARGEAPIYPTMQDKYRTESIYPEPMQKPYEPNFVSGDFNKNMQTPYNQSQTLENRYQKVASHPRLQELLQMRESILASDSKSPKRNTDNGFFSHENNGNGWETTKVAPNRETNYNYDFHLTKQDIKNIRNGKYDEALISKLEDDLGTLDNHPDWNTKVEPIDYKKMLNDANKPSNMTQADWDEANALFAKGVDNVAVGTYAGIEQDENGNISFDPEKFILGLGGYTAVKTALKNKQVQGKLKEYAQRAIDMVDMTPQVHKERGFNAMFVGANNNPKGMYSGKAKKGVVELGSHNVNKSTYGDAEAKLEVFERSPYAQGRNSINTIEVDDAVRKSGKGTELLKSAKADYDNLSAQVSNTGTVEFFYKNGFRPISNKNMTLDEAKEAFKQNGSSLNMEWRTQYDDGAFSDIATKQTMREIDDSNINYKPIPKQKIDFDGREFEQNYANLGDIIDHPELFEKYPELKDMQVSINDIGGRGGSYNRGIDAIALDRGNVSKVVSDEEEAIRAQIRELDANPIDAEYAKLNAQLIDEATPPEQLMAIDEAISKTPTAQKMQELQTQLYKVIDDADKIAKGAKYLTDYGKGTLLHEVQHAVQERENWARGGSTKDEAVINEAIKDLYKNYKHLPYIKNLVDGVRNGTIKHTEYKSKILDIANSTQDGGLRGYLHGMYERLWGEQQARATAYRKDMTPGQRASESWTDTLKREEGEYKDPIVKYDGDVSMMSPVKSKEQKEMRGIYNVTFNGKNATEVRKADSEELIKYAKGNKNQGATHIQKHLEDGSVGEVTTQELLNIGDVIRNGKLYENYGKNVYELEKDGVRFRVIAGSGKNDNEKIITFYSNRNLEEKKGYEISLITDNSSSNEKIIPQTQKEVDIVNMRDFKKRIAGKEEDIQRLVKSYAYAKSRHPEKVYRGVADENNLINNSSGASSEGYGLYTTMNKSLAQDYGKVIELNGKDATPKNPLAFSDYNQYEVFMQQLMYKIAGYKRASEHSSINPNEIINTLFPDRDGIQIGSGKKTFWVKFPDINEVRDKQQYEVLFANAGHNMAGGFAGGADALINQRDYDGDGEFTFKDLAYGAGAGVAGINALKKIAPRMFVDDAGKGGVKAGLFAGERAKGYDAKAQSGKTFDGKYDGMSRFEIDDSKSFLDERKIKNIKENSHNQGANIVNQLDYSKLDNGNYEISLMKQGAKSTKDFIKLELSPDEIKRQFPEDVANKIFNNEGDDVSMLYDRDTRMFGDFDFVLHQDSGTNLSDILNHKELYENYPELKNMDVAFSDDTRGAFFGSAEHPDGSIKPIIVIGRLPKNDTKSALLHEIQHAIQKEEGFARGGSVQEFYNDAKKKIELLKYENEFEVDDFIYDKRAKEIAKLEDKFSSGAKEEAFDMYKKLAGEIEARDVQARMDYTPQQRENVAPYSSENIDAEDAILKFDNSNDDLVNGLKQMSEEAPKKKVGNVVDRAINKGFKTVANAIDDATGNRISGAYNSIKEKEIVDNIIGHKIYEKKDYMDWRDDALRERSERGIELQYLHAKLSELPSDTREALYDYMTGNKNVELSDVLKKLGDKFIGEINNKGAQLVDEGIISEQAFETWKGKYLKRRYASKMGSLKNAFAQAKGKTIDPVYARGKIWKGSEDELAQLEADRMIGNIADGKVEVTEFADGKYQFRRDWTPQERKNMGEIKDISFSIPDTLSHLDEMVAHAKLIRKVAGKYVADAEKVAKSTDKQLENLGYKKLSGERFGALNGQWVEKSVANDIIEFDTQLNGTGKSVRDAIAEYMKWYKSIHTIYNPKTHFNNIMSNLVGFAFMDGKALKTMKIAGSEIGKGVFPTSVTTKAKTDALIELSAKRDVGTATAEEISKLIDLQKDADVSLWMEARKSGLFGKDQLNDVLNTYMQPRMKKVDGALSKVHQKAGEVYQFEDDIVRFALFKQFKDDGLDTQQAIKEVGKIIPDYSKPMSQVANWLRRYGVAPFIAFPYYSTPIMMRQIAERPTRPLVLASAIYGLYQAQGLDMFDEKEVPQRFKKSYAPFMKSGDKVYGVKYDRWLPHLDLLKVHKMAIDTMWSSNPYVSLGGAVKGLADDDGGYSPYFGGKITYNKGLEGKADILGTLAKGFVTPDIADGAYDLISSLARSEKSRKTTPIYNPKNAGQNILNVLGLNTISYNKSAQRKKAISEEMKK